MAFKITGENIYLRKALEADMPTLATAADFRPGSVTPNSDQQKYYWYRENKANIAAVTEALASDSGYGTMFLTICKKSNDSILGFHRLLYLNQKVESGFTAIIPSERDNGYYKEVGILRHKFYFQGLQATSASMKLPTDISHYLDTYILQPIEQEQYLIKETGDGAQSVLQIGQLGLMLEVNLLIKHTHIH